ncbi:Kdo2-lipid IVA lauroyltransferase/acyltransferase [uncultured Thiomicrorhabdus sp.]
MKSRTEKQVPLGKRVMHSMGSWLVIALLHLLNWLPFSWVQKTGKAIGTLLYWLPNKQRFIARRNIAAAFSEFTAAQQDKTVKSVLQHNTQTICELGKMWLADKDSFSRNIVEVHGQGLLEQAVDKNQGVLLLAPHIGNWEVIGNFIAMQYPATYMYRPPRLPGIEKMMCQSRMRFGAKLVPTDIRGVRTIIQALKKGDVSAILPDQDAKENGVYAPFFGIEARTMTLASRLLQKTDSACFFIIALRRPQGGFVIHLLPTNREALADSDPEVATKALNEGVEQCVNLAPEQYLWTYRRYRGKADVY